MLLTELYSEDEILSRVTEAVLDSGLDLELKTTLEKYQEYYKGSLVPRIRYTSVEDANNDLESLIANFLYFISEGE
jgi:hypothetical protein